MEGVSRIMNKAGRPVIFFYIIIVLGGGNQVMLTQPDSVSLESGPLRNRLMRHHI